MKLFKAGIIAATFILSGTLGAQAVEHNTADGLAPKIDRHMSEFGETLPPIGYVGFCKQHPSECKASALEPVRVVMNNERWRELTQINSYINKTVQPVTDQELYNTPERWTYPKGYGDCEDYVLLKRRYLINLGWPKQALLITVVLDQNNQGHAVLTVATDLGDFILDNQAKDVLPWKTTPYKYVKRQSQSRTNGWVMLKPARRIRSASARNFMGLFSR